MYLITDPYAIIAASNISVFIILLIGLSVIYSIIRKRAAKTENAKQFLVNLINSNILRIPTGFFILIFGLLLKYAIRIPITIYEKTKDLVQLELMEQRIGPPIQLLSETMVYIGFCIIFWPTILQIAYRKFGAGYNPNFYTTVSLLFLLLFKIILSIVGLMLYFALTY